MDDALLLSALRSICGAWSEVIESVTFGSNLTLKSGRKAFAVVDCYRGVRFPCFQAPDAATRALLLRDRRFFEPPFDPRKTWIALRSGGIRGKAELREIIHASYRSVALKRMLTALDNGAAAPQARTPKPKPRTK